MKKSECSFSKRLGKIIKKLMKKQGFSVKEMSKSLNLTKKETKRILKGDLLVRPVELQTIATMLNTTELDDWLKKYTTQYFSDRDTKILSIETCGDHIHILFEAPPQINLADFVNAYKSASSRRIRAEFSEYLRPFYWKPYFWSLSYFIATVSERSTEAVKNYIANQKSKSAFIHV